MVAILNSPFFMTLNRLHDKNTQEKIERSVIGTLVPPLPEITRICTRNYNNAVDIFIQQPDNRRPEPR